MTSKKKKKGKKSRSKFSKFLRTFFFIIFLILLLIGFVFGAKYISVFMQYNFEAQRIVGSSTPDTFKAEQTSLVYDLQGNIITSMSGEKDVYYLDSSQIPYLVKQAFISSEDRDFYEHDGVDNKALLRALWSLIKNSGEITQGGSTITQQLAKNIFLTQDVTFERKLRELFIAKELEEKYSKEELLEYYINTNYFANGYYGIEAASQGYFGRSSVSLSLSETAFLCSIPNSPARYDPFINIDNTLARRNRILKQMLNMGAIDRQMYSEALAEEILLTPEPKASKNNYVETYVRHCAIIKLMEETGFEIKTVFSSSEDETNYNLLYEDLYKEFSSKLYTGGYRIYTSIDLSKQALLQQSVDERLSDYTDVSEEGIYTLQASAVCVDNETGYVSAIVGGRSQDFSGYTINRAYQSTRQPGSSIKPLIVYTPLFERGVTPDTTEVDGPIAGGPKNAGGGYSGTQSLRQAITFSTNTIAWKMFDKLTPQVGLAYLEAMNFSRLDPRDYSLAASLGGFTYGVSTLEMASAYSALENDGFFRTPTCIIKITDADNNLITQGNPPPKVVYQKNACRIMTNVLKDVLTYGTGRAYKISNAICAGKTGTTNDTNDSWFIGYSTYYTTAVWVGYDYPKSLDPTYGRISSGMIWKAYMEQIHTGLEQKDFPAYIPPVTTPETSVPETTTPLEEETQETTEENVLYQEETETTTVSPESFIEEDN